MEVPKNVGESEPDYGGEDLPAEHWIHQANADAKIAHAAKMAAGGDDYLTQLQKAGAGVPSNIGDSEPDMSPDDRDVEDRLFTPRPKKAPK